MPRRGRPPTHEEIVLDLQDDGKLEWHTTYVVLKKRSIGGKMIRGNCYTKLIAHEIKNGQTFGNYELERLYATKKEMFKDTLRYENES